MKLTNPYDGIWIPVPERRRASVRPWIAYLALATVYLLLLELLEETHKLIPDRVAGFYDINVLPGRIEDDILALRGKK